MKNEKPSASQQESEPQVKPVVWRILPEMLTEAEIAQLRQHKRELVALAQKAFPKGWASRS